MSEIKRNLPNDQYQAAIGANSPSSLNTYATIADILGSGGNRVISGNASYSGTGFIYDVSALTYIIQGTLYASAATQVTLGASDPTFDRIDIIAADTGGNVIVIAGTPAAVPSPPAVDNLTQVAVTFVVVGAGTTSPTVTIVDIYDENLQVVGGEWNTSTTSGNVVLNDTTDPYQGTIHIGTTGNFGTNSNITLAPAAPYTLNGGQLTFWLKAKTSMIAGASYINVGLFVGGSLEGNFIKIGGGPGIDYGFDTAITGTYQLVTIPIADFNVTVADIDDLRFFTGIGPATAEFDLDVVRIEEAVPTPGPNPIYLPDLADVDDNILPPTTTNADDGRLLHYSNETKEWVADDIVTHGTLVLNTHSDGAQTGVGGYGIAGQIKKGNPVYLTTAGITDDLQEVGIADASDPNKMPVIGFAAEDILVATTDAKHVIKFGKIQGIDTSGSSAINADSPTVWTVGQDLYMSAIQGKLTSQRPQGTTIVQKVAKVLKIGSTDGSLMIINSARAAGLPNLTNGNIWIGNASAHPVETTLPTAGHVIEDEGTPLTQRPTIDFQGAGVTVTDDAGNNQTVVTVSGGGGGGGWNPPKSSLEDWTRGNTAALTTAANGDLYFFFVENTGAPGGVPDPQITTKFHLGKENGLDYDGSNLALRLHNQLFILNGVGGDNVRWEVEYIFLLDGDDGVNKASTTFTFDVDYSTRTVANGLYTDVITGITGVAGAKELRIWLRRKNTDAADTYNQDVDFFGIDLIKV